LPQASWAAIVVIRQDLGVARQVRQGHRPPGRFCICRDAAQGVDERPEYAWKPKKWHVRDIPIPPEFAADLLKMKEIAKHPLVFHTRSGKPIYQMLEMCKRIAARAGIPREEAYLHKWRATYCVELLRQGVDLPSIQAAMGHKDLASPGTTQNQCCSSPRGRVLCGQEFGRLLAILTLGPFICNSPTQPPTSG